MFKKFVMAAAIAAMAVGGYAYDWDNVGPDQRLGGRMISAGYLRGKVVLLDRRDYTDPANADTIRQLQTLWATYKTKPFILLGSQQGAADKEQVGTALKKLGVTYPVYLNAGLVTSDGSSDTSVDTRHKLIVLDSTCQRKLYAGRDPHAVQGVVGSAILAASSPTTPRQYNFLLDYEVTHLPGRAYLRLKEYRADFPKDAEKYASAWERFSGSDEVRKLAELVECSRSVKDRDTSGETVKRLTPEALQSMMAQYASLKESKDPFVVQEAKNALADIKFVACALGEKK